MPDIRVGPPANVGEPVAAETVVVGDVVVARLVTELAEARAALARAEARTAALVEAVRDAIDCLERVLDGDRPYSLSQREEVRLAFESLRAALAGADGRCTPRISVCDRHQRAGGEGEADA
jgi:hypothetical protein